MKRITILLSVVAAGALLVAVGCGGGAAQVATIAVTGAPSAVSQSLTLTSASGQPFFAATGTDSVTWTVPPGNYTLKLPIISMGNAAKIPICWQKHFVVSAGDARSFNASYSDHPSSNWILLVDVDGLEARTDAGQVEMSGFKVSAVLDDGSRRPIDAGSPLYAYRVFSSPDAATKVEVSLSGCSIPESIYEINPGSVLKVKGVVAQ